jgi:hypothetical protein
MRNGAIINCAVIVALVAIGALGIAMVKEISEFGVEFKFIYLVFLTDRRMGLDYSDVLEYSNASHG